MPSTVSLTSLPPRVRGDANGPRQVISAHLRAFLTSDDASSSAVAYGADDGVTSETVAALSQQCRIAAKTVGRRVRVQWDENSGTLFVADGGEYKERPAEKRAETAAKRAATMAGKVKSKTTK